MQIFTVTQMQEVLLLLCHSLIAECQEDHWSGICFFAFSEDDAGDTSIPDRTVCNMHDTPITQFTN